MFIYNIFKKKEEGFYFSSKNTLIFYFKLDDNKTILLGYFFNIYDESENAYPFNLPVQKNVGSIN